MSNHEQIQNYYGKQLQSSGGPNTSSCHDTAQLPGDGGSNLCC